jgi:acetoin:2,6-dichlorophenolindophenol oxidoreductase subunit alpha
MTKAKADTGVAELYRQLYLIRVFETRCIQLYRKGLIRGYFHPYLGEEAIAVGACAALEARDYIVSTHRGHGHCIARGARIDAMVAELLGRETGYSHGRGGSMHIADVATGNLGANGIVGGGIPMGVGAALGSWIRGEDRVAVIFFSDGAVTNGVFGESLNLAAAFGLPAVFLIENNHYQASTPVERVVRSPDLWRRGEAMGVASWPVDGNDVLAVRERTREAVAICRSGKGPALIEAKTWRHMGHHVNDPGAYMPAEKTRFFKEERDPVAIGRAYLARGLEEADIAAIERAVEAEMDRAIAFAESSPEPSLESFLAEVER